MPPPPDTSVAPAITTEKTIQPGESKTDFKARCLEACLSGGQCLGYSMDKSQSACTIYTVNVPANATFSSIPLGSNSPEWHALTLKN